MSPTKGFLALTLNLSLGFAQQDADIPPKFKSIIDDATYFQLRSDYLNMLRGLPANPALRAAAIQQMQQPRFSTTGVPTITPAWTPLGPSPIPNGQVTGSLPVSGRTTAIAIDPTNSNIFYLGTAQGGVYRTTDGGSNWTPIFDTASTSAIGALALAPSNHTILYIGTGEANGSADSYAGVGMYRVDNADTAATLVGPINPIRNYTNGSGNPVSNPVFNGRSISSISVNPTDPSIVYVGVAGGVVGIGGESPLGNSIPPLGMRGLYRLTNATQPPASVAVQKIAVATAAAGFDLPNTGNRNIDSMAVDPTNPNVMVVWVNGTNTVGDGGVYVSLNATLPSPTFVQTLVTTTTSARAIFASYKQASNSMVIYAATGESFNSSGAGRLRVSTDAGATWTLLAGGNGFCGGQCFYNIGIDVLTGPSTAVSDDVVVLGGNTPGGPKLFAKSTDGGVTFTESSAGLHADTHFIKFDPNNANVIYHGDDGGIFKSLNAGSTWSSLSNSQINSVQFSGLAVHPVDPKFSLGGTQDNGTNMRNAAGAWNRVDFGDGGYALIDRNATDTTNVTLYHTYYNQTNNLIGFARVLSTACASDGLWAFKGVYGGAVDPTPNCDGSDTFNGIAFTDSVLFYAPMELGPGNPSTVYFGAGALYRSADKGQTMPAVSQRTTSPISTIAVSPLDDNFRLFGRQDGSIWYTTTGSTTMTQLNGIPVKYVARVKFDPQNQNTAYVALGGYFGGTAASQSHIWKVSNLSATPSIGPLNGGLPDVPFNAFAVDPANSSNLFAGSDIGVFASLDGGTTWAPYGTGLPVVAVFGMEIQPVSRTLRIATHGRGMWEIALPSVLGSNVITFNAPPDTPLSGSPVALTATASSGLPVSYASNSTTICTISGTSAVLVTTGICSITASQAGNGSFGAAAPVTKTFNVLANGNVITFNAPSDTSVLGGSVSLTATASSGLPVSYTSNSTSICTISATNAILVAPGVCSITASQAGNATFAAATPVTKTFNVLPASQTITWAPIPTQTVGVPLTLTASASSGLPVSYMSTSTSVCTVAGNVASFLGAGPCILSASQAGNGFYAPAPTINQTFPVQAGGANTISNVQAFAIGATSELITWTTSAPATSQVNFGLNTGYGSSSPLDNTLVTQHSVTLSNLTPKTTYNFDVVSSGVTSNNGLFTTGTPFVGYLAFWGVSNSGVSISWSTDVPANAVVAYGTTPALGQLSPLQPALTTGHGAVLAGLNSGTTYYFMAESTDANGNMGASTIYSFTTTGAPSSPAPVISNVNVTAITTTSATINWTTDVASSSLVNYGTTIAYGSSSPLAPPPVLSHSITLTGLTPGTLYNFDVVSQNNSGTATGTSSNYTFTTTASTSNPPTITNVATSNITSSSVTITWNTDQPSWTQVNYGYTTSYGSSSPQDTNLVTSHSVTLTNLTANTNYNFSVKSTNAGGQAAASPNGTFATLLVSTAPPPVVGYVAFWGVNNSGVTISWSTDVPADTQVAFGTTPALGQLSPLQTALTASHGVVLTGLNSGTTYYFVAQSKGANGATGYSTTFTFTTLGTASAPPTITNVGVSSITNTSAVISWTTDQPSSSLVNYGPSSYTSTTPVNPALVTSHSVTLTNLTQGTTYNFDVVSVNSAGGTGTSPNATFMTTGTVPAAPVITNIKESNITSSSVLITWTTDIPASSLVNYGTTGYTSASTPDPTLVTSHSVTLMGLTPSTTYNFDVVSTNSSAMTTTSPNNTFTTAAASASAPQVSFVAFWGVTSSAVTISWSTNVPATTQVMYGTTTALGQTSPVQTALTTSHGLTLGGLNPGTTYYFMAQSADINGVIGQSTIYSFTTLASTGPVISNVSVNPVAGNTATIQWTTSVPAYSYVQFGAITGVYGKYSARTGLTSSPVCNLGYVPSGTIHYQLVSVDAAGNTTMSADLTFVEP